MLGVFEGFIVRDDHKTCNGVRHRTSRGHFEVLIRVENTTTIRLIIRFIFNLNKLEQRRCDIMLRKVILCYPEWTSKRIFMGDIQRSGLDLVKVARDFDNLTLPEPSTNIVLRFTYYDMSSPFPNAMKANPKNQLWLQNESN
ncbi:hypothetical protein CFP56_010318 [Quercus suber]|uniref:Uncharacterized protein n=1 Tax=Quercus suber TaxID=58331 RepID=A0AAW0L3E1_QUESU